MDIKLILMFGFFFALASSSIAKKKHRNTRTWFLLGFLFGIIPFITIFFLKSLKPTFIQRQKKDLSILNIDNNYWYYLDGKNQKGPMSLKKVFEEHQKGFVKLSTYVWNDTMKNWTRIKDISKISDLFTS